jgi:hypothetical protein
MKATWRGQMIERAIEPSRWTVYQDFPRESVRVDLLRASDIAVQHCWVRSSGNVSPLTSMELLSRYNRFPQLGNEKSGRMPNAQGGLGMTHSNLKVEALGPCIYVAMRGSCLRMTFRRQEAPWLSVYDLGPDDADAKVTQAEFRALAWAAANAKARELDWLK